MEQVEGADAGDLQQGAAVMGERSTPSLDMGNVFHAPMALNFDLIDEPFHRLRASFVCRCSLRIEPEDQ